MESKLRLITNGKHTFIELGGKTIGRGIEGFHLSQNMRYEKEPILDLRINLNQFEYMPDGYFEEVENSMTENARPTTRYEEAMTIATSDPTRQVDLR